MGEGADGDGGRIQQGQQSVDQYLDALPDFDAFKDYPPFVALFAPRG